MAQSEKTYTISLNSTDLACIQAALEVGMKVIERKINNEKHDDAKAIFKKHLADVQRVKDKVTQTSLI